MSVICTIIIYRLKKFCKPLANKFDSGEKLGIGGHLQYVYYMHLQYC